MGLDTFTKITYHHESGKKISFYRDLSGCDELMDSFAILDNMIFTYLTEEHKVPVGILRKYWIDDDGDEISIANQGDFRLYVKSNRRHIHCDNLKLGKDGQQPNVKFAVPNEAPFEGPIHPTVSCDGCQMTPMIGFRYKCVECKNFDLCEKCESEHKHPEHLMLRIPKNMSQFDVDFRFVPNSRRSRHHQKSGCPFYLDVTPKGSDNENADGHKKKHHHHSSSRRADRRSMRNSIFTHLYDMMHDLAEGGGAMERNEVPTPTKAADGEKKPEPQKKSGDQAAASAPSFEELIKKAQDNMQVAAEQMNLSEKLASDSKSEEKKTQTEKPVAQEAKPAEVSAAASSEAAIQQSLYPFENLSQIVDPQYMKAGIQILNNFSEMFAKMLDPVENESASSSAAPSLSISSDKPNSENAPVEKEVKSEEPPKPEEMKQDAVDKPLLEEPVPKEKPEPSLGAIPRRSPSSDEDDWQLVCKDLMKANEKFKPVSDDSVQGAVGGEPLAPTVQPVASERTSITVATQCESPKKKEEDVVYHKDPVINNAVINMMAMGFSNEGAWLTQLLESAKGNIPAALDIMSNAQRQNN